MSSALPAAASSGASGGLLPGAGPGAITPTGPVCCELFIEALNRSPAFAPLSAFREATEALVVGKLSFLTPLDVSLYLDYCQTWQQK